MRQFTYSNSYDGSFYWCWREYVALPFPDQFLPMRENHDIRKNNFKTS